MNKRSLVIAIALIVLLIAAFVGSRSFMASTDQPPGQPSPHAINQ